MKARVKATGEIVEVMYSTEMGVGTSNGVYLVQDLEEIESDYWTRLEHTYAGMAMQGLSKKYFKEYRDYCAGFGDMDEDEAKGAMKDFANAMADVCYYFAHALVEKMKEVK